MTPTDGVLFSGLTGNSPVFALKGGVYFLSVAGGTISGVQLAALGPDQATFLAVGPSTALAAAGIAQLGYLPMGQYRINSTGTSINVAVCGCPNS